MWIGLRYDHFNHYIMVDIYPAWISHYFCLAKFEKSPSTLEDWSLIQSYSSSLPNQHLCSCLCMYTVVCLHPPSQHPSSWIHTFLCPTLTHADQFISRWNVILLWPQVGSFTNSGSWTSIILGDYLHCPVFFWLQRQQSKIVKISCLLTHLPHTQIIKWQIQFTHFK